MLTIARRFLQECKEAGKKVMAWTVNEPVQMIEVRMGLLSISALNLTREQATRWGVDVILTDNTKTWLDLRATLRSTSCLDMAIAATDVDLSGLRQDPRGAQQPVPVDVAAVLLPAAEDVAEHGVVYPAEGRRAVQEVR